MTDSVRVAHGDDGVTIVTLNRPHVLNALDVPSKERLGEVWSEAAASPKTKVLLLHGAGEKGFSAGSDIKEIRRTGKMVTTETLMRAIPGVGVTLEKPVIAALHGFTVGFGLTLAIHCDFRIAAPTSRMGFPEVQHGMLSGISAITLPGIVGEPNALDLMLTGRMIDGNEALAMGLVNRLAEDPYAEALTLARLVASNSTHAVQLTKRLVLHNRRQRIADAAALVDAARLEVTRSQEFGDVVEDKAGTGRVRG
jgi:enoyl-CoA hydratase